MVTDIHKSVARMRNMRNAYKFLVGNPEERGESQDLGVDGRTEKYGWRVWIGFIWLEIRTNGRLL
jgi:hypothetical protein